MRRTPNKKMLTLLLIGMLMSTICMLTLALQTRPAKADPGYTYIHSNGDVDPEDRPIHRDGDYYTQTGDLTEGIIIERDNMTLDGNISKIIGPNWAGIGVNVTGRNHVMLKNLQIEKFQRGVELNSSNFCQVYNSNVLKGDNTDGESVGICVRNSTHVTLFHDKVTETPGSNSHNNGIELFDSTYNTVLNCTLQHNDNDHPSDGLGYGILLDHSSNNNVFDNQVIQNHDGIVWDGNSDYNNIAYNIVTQNGGDDHAGVGVELAAAASHNTITKNYIGDNFLNALSLSNSSFWDGGYASYANGGNKWVDYTGADNNSDFIGDTPYFIRNSTATNSTYEQDNYPLMQYNYTYRTLTVESGGNGTTDPVPFTYPYRFPGMNVTVTATPDPDYSFDHWLVNGTVNNTNPITIAIDSNYNLTAVFQNEPPNPPSQPSGPTPCYVYSTRFYPYTGYNYTTNATDPEGQNLNYTFQFWNFPTPMEDNTTVGPYSSGSNATVSHVWTQPGPHNVTVMATDTFGLNSSFSNLSVSVLQNDDGTGGDAGHAFATATLYTGSYDHSGTLYPSLGNPEDWYQFFVGNGQTIQVNLTSPSNCNFDVQLYDNGTVLKATSNSTSQNDYINFTADSNGYWRVRIYNVTGEGLYDHFYIIITGQQGGGCPYAATWTGTGYTLDNNILPASETGNGTDTTDWYKLEQQLQPVSTYQEVSVYTLQLLELEQEHDYIDQVRLLAVDHASDTKTAVTPEGEVVTYKDPAAPVTCVDDGNVSRLSEVSGMDGNVSDSSTYFQGYEDNWLLLDFGNVSGSHANLVLRDDQKCSDDECISVQVPSANGSWQTVEMLHPRDLWGMEAVNMSAYIPTTGNFTVRLLWTATHRLDYVGLDTSTPAQTQVSCSSPTAAAHSALGDVTAGLLYDDEDCVELVNDEQITLVFAIPNKAQGTTRDFILCTNGYYYTITP